jgi:hypothetical protein
MYAPPASQSITSYVNWERIFASPIGEGSRRTAPPLKQPEGKKRNQNSDEPGTFTRSEALECGSSLPLSSRPACWMGIVLAAEFPRAADLEFLHFQFSTTPAPKAPYLLI